MKKIILIGLSLFATSIFSQSFDSLAWKYASTITKEDLKKHLEIIASDEYEGRETGRKGQKMAMDYLINQFKSYGIQDFDNRNYIQSYTIIEQKNEGVTLKIGGKEYAFNEDFIIRPKLMDKTEISTEIVFVGYGIEEESYNNYKGLDVENKAVFIWDGKPTGKTLSKEWSGKEKVELAKSKGASAVFMYNEKLSASLSMFKHFYEKPSVTLKGTMEEEMPIIFLTKEPTKELLLAGKIKLDKLEKKGLKKTKSFAVEMELKVNKPIDEFIGENVLAYIPGNEKEEEVVVITAHYDHIGKTEELIFNGADDDGTGTVSLIEIAQAFMQAVENGNGPKRSILIMPVSGEEKGLLGSKYYADNPVFPLENTVANLNVDMIGRYDKAHEKDSNYIYLIGSDRLSNDLHEVSEQTNKTYLNIGLDYTFNDEKDPNRFYYRSDHYNFAKNNVPVIFYFSGVHEDYHKATDTVEKIDYKKTAKVAKLIFLTAWELANREERVKLNEGIGE